MLSRTAATNRCTRSACCGSSVRKFAPIWEPRYLATADLTPFATLTNIAGLVGGGMKGILAK